MGSSRLNPVIGDVNHRPLAFTEPSASRGNEDAVRWVIGGGGAVAVARSTQARALSRSGRTRTPSPSAILFRDPNHCGNLHSDRLGARKRSRDSETELLRIVPDGLEILHSRAADPARAGAFAKKLIEYGGRFHVERSAEPAHAPFNDVPPSPPVTGRRVSDLRAPTAPHHRPSSTYAGSPTIDSGDPSAVDSAGLRDLTRGGCVERRSSQQYPRPDPAAGDRGSATSEPTDDAGQPQTSAGPPRRVATPHHGATSVLRECRPRR